MPLFIFCKFELLTREGRPTRVFGRSINPGGGVVVVCIFIIGVLLRVSGSYRRGAEQMMIKDMRKRSP